ncbi:CYP509 protein, partial [Phycomyces blakesleeanus NRRL 1555(-)]
WTVYTANPEAVQYILMKGEIFPKDTNFMNVLSRDSLTIRFFGSSNVAFISGEPWKHQRKTMNPAFRRTAPVDLFGRIVPDMFRLIDKTDGNIFIFDLLQRVTFDALGKALFGFDFRATVEEDSAWRAAYIDTMAGVTAPILNIIPSLEYILRYFYPDYNKASKGVDKLNALILDMVNKKKKKLEESKDQPDGGQEKDLLTLILEAEMKENKSSESDDLRANMATFIMAGHETTASSVSHCIYYMAMNKNVQNKARREALDILGDDSSTAPPTFDDCKRINYINMIVKEALRLSVTSGALMDRVATEDVTLAGEFIPKGTYISVDIEALHKNPTIWKNPTVFDPERFSKGGEHEQHRGITWAPFSDGNRKCLGVNFSMAEQQVLLLMLLKHYEWDLSENSIHKNGIVYNSIFSFAPKTLSIKFHKRH